MSSSDDDGLPAWMSSYKSPVKRNGGRIPIIDLTSSDDDDDPPGADGEAEPTEAAAKSQHHSPAESGSDAEGEPAPSKPATAQPAGKARQPDRSKPAAAPPRKQPRPDQNLFAGMSAEKCGKSARPQKAGSAADVAAGSPADDSAAAAKHRSPGSKPSAAVAATSSKAVSKAKHAPATAADATAMASSAAAVAPDSAAAGKPTPKLVAAPVAGELPVMLPEKLQKFRMIAEIESVEGGATDLTGDSGAVGRVLVHGEDDHRRVQFDLKGVVYDARLASLPGTLCVVNIGQTEAKVEAVMHSFLQLVRSDADNAEEDDHRLFMDEDDDDMFQPAYARAAGGDEDAKPGKNKAVKRRAASGSRPSGVKKPRKAPAKKAARGTKAKPAAKPRAKK